MKTNKRPMGKRGLILTVFLLFLTHLSAALSDPGTGTLYGTDASGGGDEFEGGGGGGANLLIVDTETGASAIVGPMGGFPAPSLATDTQAGIMYAGQGGGTANIYTVDPNDGSTTLLGFTGLELAAVGGLDFSPNGVLFAAVNIVGDGGTGSEHLATISTVDGTATVIGPFGDCPEAAAPGEGDGNGLLCTIEGIEAIAFDASGNLYGAKSQRGPAGDPGLYQINTTTGEATFLYPILDAAGAPPTGGVVSLQFGCDGTLWGGTARAIEGSDGGFLIRVDPDTGDFEFVGGVSATGGSSLGGLAFSEPCGTPGEARFLVSKEFDDNNTAEVEVTLSCNTGLPLEQTTMISEGDPVNFVVVDFEDGTMDCEVTEVVPDGYTASYANGQTVSSESCAYEDIFGDQHSCVITNSLDQVEVAVTKVWIDEKPQFNAINLADAAWLCQNVAGGGSDGGMLNFFENPDTESIFIYPDWELGTVCRITEVNVPDGGVEVDDSECDAVIVFPGVNGACTIFNTRLFEGIPTLSQYGLVVLVLLMLGVGLVGFRRFV